MLSIRLVATVRIAAWVTFAEWQTVAGRTATRYAVAIDQQGDKPGQDLDSGGLFA
jgi:hypothetical protein